MGQESSADETSNGAGIVFTSQPKDSEVCIGSSAEMHCSYYGTDTLPMWSINSASYTSLRLPPYHKYSGHILTVDNVFVAQNGSTYQCYFDRYFSNGTFYQVRSNIGRLNILTSDACVQHRGPANITRNEGEQNIFIPCPLSGLVLPAWKINGSFYELNQIPEQYVPAYGGIYVRVAWRELNGTVFQCYTRTGHGFISEASSIGILTVTFTDTTPSKQELHSSTSCINPGHIFASVAQKVHFESNYLYLDHQNMRVDEHNITLSWKSTNLDCSIFKIKLRNDCGYQNELQPEEITFTALSSSFSFPISDVEDKPEIDIYIESVNDQDILCQTMKETIQIYKPATFLERVPSSLELIEINFITAIHTTFYVVLPQRFNSSNQPDCFCPVVFHDQETCYQLDTCSCINSTVFGNSSIEVCYLTEEAIYLVIKNLTNEMNNTNIHIFHGFYCDTYFIPPYRIYTHQFQILIVLPEPPNVHVDEKNATIYFCPNLVDGISLDSFEITIYDRTGQVIFNTVTILSATTACYTISLEEIDSEFHKQVCAPFLVSTSAINWYGRSTTNVTMHPITNFSDRCSCLKFHVEVNVVIIKTCAKVNCLRMEYESTLMIEIRANEFTAATVICSGDSLEEEVHLQDLDCTKQYNLSAVWVFNDSNIYEECLLFKRSAVSFECSAQKQIILMASIIPGGVCLIVIVTVVFIGSVYCFKKRNKKKYQPIN